MLRPGLPYGVSGQAQKTSAKPCAAPSRRRRRRFSPTELSRCSALRRCDSCCWAPPETCPRRMSDAKVGSVLRSKGERRAARFGCGRVACFAETVRRRSTHGRGLAAAIAAKFGRRPSSWPERSATPRPLHAMLRSVKPQRTAREVQTARGPRIVDHSSLKCASTTTLTQRSEKGGRRRASAACRRRRSGLTCPLAERCRRQGGPAARARGHAERLTWGRRSTSWGARPASHARKTPGRAQMVRREMRDSLHRHVRKLALAPLVLAPLIKRTTSISCMPHSSMAYLDEHGARRKAVRSDGTARPMPVLPGLRQECRVAPRTHITVESRLVERALFGKDSAPNEQLPAFGSEAKVAGVAGDARPAGVPRC
jgi:hypothetical protein